MLAQVALAPARDWGEAFMTSMTNALSMFLTAIPRIIGFAIILGVGWFIAGLLGKGVAALLRTVKFNELANRSGLTHFVQEMGVRNDASGVIASVATWFVRLIVLVVAFDALGIAAVSGVLQQLLLWLPNLVVALVALVIGGLLANALGNLVRGATSEAGFRNPDTLATVARVTVWAFAVVVAVNQLGIATVVVNTLLIGTVGALALASGLAFGLGGRDRAAQMLDSAGRAASENAPKLRRAASAMGDGGGDLSMPRDPSMWRERSGADRRRTVG